MKIVDKFGQLKLKDWPGKIKSEEELKTVLENAKKYAADNQNRGGYFSDWSKYGGWKGKKYEGTGFFSTKYDGNRWWLLDPEGHVFFSTGIDCVSPGEKGRVDGMEKLFDWLPETDSDFKEAWSKNERGKYFDFYISNLIRIFGQDWWQEWAKITESRLYNWGINTVGNWSDRKFIHYATMPYVWQLKNFPETEKKFFRDFPDVFDEEYLKEARKYASQMEQLKNDKNMIGYFLRNEPHWAFAEGINIAEKLLETEEDFASKDVLIEFLIERYSGNINKFNSVWNLSLDNFNQLKKGIKEAASLSCDSEKDLKEFSRILIDRYVRIPSQEVRKVDPNHLNLGMRYAYITDESLLTGTDCFDVYSINCYQIDPFDSIDEVGKMTDKPIIIGEFHFGALDRGLVATGLRGVSSQRERGKAYRYYLERCAMNKYCVGAHYFILNDQGVLGRFDGENYQIGIVDVCHQPYQEMISEIRKTNQDIYKIMSGEKKPGLIMPEEIEKV